MSEVEAIGVIKKFLDSCDYNQYDWTYFFNKGALIDAYQALGMLIGESMKRNAEKIDKITEAKTI